MPAEPQQCMAVPMMMASAQMYACARLNEYFIVLYDTYGTHGFARERARFRGVCLYKLYGLCLRTYKSSVDSTVCRTTSLPVSVPFSSYSIYTICICISTSSLC